MIGSAASTAGGNLDQNSKQQKKKKKVWKHLMLRPVSQPPHQDSEIPDGHGKDGENLEAVQTSKFIYAK